MLNIALPIIQAPMAGSTSSELVAAVSNAGGLGSLGAGLMAPTALRESIEKIRRLTDKPFSINLMIPEPITTSEAEVKHICEKLKPIADELKTEIIPPQLPLPVVFEQQIEVILAENVPVFSFTFGALEERWLAALKDNNAIVMGTATTLEEGQFLESTGVDVVVAQSFEAGGHRGTFQKAATSSIKGGFALIPALVDHLDCPVVAAGSIMDARSTLAALMLGAQGVQMGTAFLTCTESPISALYKNALLNVKADDTVLTKAFTGKYARALVNTFTKNYTQYCDSCADFLVQGRITKAIRAAAAEQENTEFMSMWSGQSAYLCSDKSAADIITTIKAGVNELVKSFN